MEKQLDFNSILRLLRYWLGYSIYTNYATLNETADICRIKCSNFAIKFMCEAIEELIIVIKKRWIITLVEFSCELLFCCFYEI